MLNLDDFELAPTVITTSSTLSSVKKSVTCTLQIKQNTNNKSQIIADDNNDDDDDDLPTVSEALKQIGQGYSTKLHKLKSTYTNSTEAKLNKQQSINDQQNTNDNKGW